MAEAQAMQANGFNVPPIPAGATTNENRAPAPHEGRPPVHEQQPGLAPNAGQNQQQQPNTGLTAEDIKALIAQALPQQQQPAQQPTPAPAAAPAAPASVDTFEDSGDPLLASLTRIMVGTAPTLDLERAIGKAISYGDPKLIDLAYIKEQGGANAAHLTELAQSMVQRANDKANEAQQSVYKVAGDQAKWQAASSAFNTNAPQHLKVVVAKLLDSGNPEAIQAAAQTVVEFAGKSGYIPQPGQFLASGATAGVSGTALDKSEFQAELRKLNPSSKTFQQERDNLFARRQLGKQMGR